MSRACENQDGTPAGFAMFQAALRRILRLFALFFS